MRFERKRAKPNTATKIFAIQKKMNPESDNARQIGRLVRNERRQQKLDQRTLALISNVGVSAVHRVEHGEGVRVDTLTRILSALGLELTVRRRGGFEPS